MSIDKNKNFSGLCDELQGNNGVLNKAIKLENSFFSKIYKDIDNSINHENENIDIESLITPIIFNPLGPTVIIFGTIRYDIKKIELIFYRSLNPFSSASFIIGACDEAVHLDIFEVIEKVFSKNTIEGFESLQTMPTIILPASRSILEHYNSIVITIYQSLEEDISDLNQMIYKTLGNPWDLATLQLEKSIKNRNTKKQKNEFDLNLNDINEYISLTGEQEHLNGLFESIPIAWKGAIKHTALNPELSLHNLSEELECSGAGILKTNLKI